MRSIVSCCFTGLTVYEGETLLCGQQAPTEAPVDEEPPLLHHIIIFLARDLRDNLSAPWIPQDTLDEQGDTVGRRRRFVRGVARLPFLDVA